MHRSGRVGEVQCRRLYVGFGLPSPGSICILLSRLYQVVYVPTALSTLEAEPFMSLYPPAANRRINWTDASCLLCMQSPMQAAPHYSTIFCMFQD